METPNEIGEMCASSCYPQIVYINEHAGFRISVNPELG